MTNTVFLIAGATGAAALQLVSHLSRDRGLRVYALSRRGIAGLDRVVPVAADLADAEACGAALAGLADVTHVVYAARAPHGEGGVEDVADNLAMLRHLIDGIEAAAPHLQHVHLVEGGKWYGLHLGSYPTPARESDPRHLPPNFYYDQQDLLEARSAAGGWSWSASRPHLICDAVCARARSLVSVVGAYAMICRECGVPLDFPGTVASYDALTEVTDATLFAEAVTWISLTEGLAGQAYNVTNGDHYRWARLWPRIAAFFEIPLGWPRPLTLAEWMADKAEVWQAIAEKNGLVEHDLEKVADWPFADFVFGIEHDVASDTGRLRRAGFHGCRDSLAMFEEHLREYRKIGVLI